MSAAPVKKACDACHRRKVRCSGGQPCKNCGQATLQCTYLAVPQKKGPKGSRAKVISEIRDNQQQVVKTTSASRSPHDVEQSPFDFNATPVSPVYARNSELLTPQLVESCISFYFSHFYATLPVFHQKTLTELASTYHETRTEIYCLIATLCAFLMIQPGINLPGIPNSPDGGVADARNRHASSLLEEVRRLRKALDIVESPTVYSVQTSFFLFATYFCLERTNACWFHIREASTLAQLLLMHEEASYHNGDPIENMFKRRTYWLLLLTERAFAMERHRPLSLYGTIELPSEAEDPQEAHVIAGFLALVNLYRLIDEEFMAVWNRAKSECSTTWLSNLQQQLTDVLPPTFECTENQAADVRVTQHWLRTMVWQMSITNGHLSSSSPDVAMTFRYPYYIARDLVNDVRRLSLQSMEVHGNGLIEKLFDVACTLTDVITLVPLDNDPEVPPDAPAEYLNQLLNVITQLRGGTSKFQPLLVSKLSENLPSWTSPVSSAPSLAVSQSSFSPEQSSNPAMPLPLLAAATASKPQQFHLPSPFHGVGMSMSPFSEHTRGLMFDGYSPTVSHSDMAMTPLTPPIGASPQGMFGAHPQGQPPLGLGSGSTNVPRSVPSGTFANGNGLKFEGYNG